MKQALTTRAPTTVVEWDYNLSDGVTGGGVTNVVTLQHCQGPSVDGNVLGRGQEIEKEEHATLKEK